MLFALYCTDKTGPQHPLNESPSAELVAPKAPPYHPARETMLRFFKRRAIRKELEEKGYKTLGQLSDEDIKSELNDVMLQTAFSGAIVNACAQSYYAALDTETAETILEDAIAIVRTFTSAFKRQSDHANISYLYAMIYLTHAANNALCLDNDWREFYGAMQMCIDADVKKKHDIREGYA